MNPNKLGFKDILAVVIAFSALAGLIWMFNGEAAVVGDAAADPSVLAGLQQYSWGMGLILLASGLAYVLLGREDDIITDVDQQEGKK